MIQRRLRVGYTRAGRLIDMLERRGDHLRLRGLEAAPGAGLRRPTCRACWAAPGPGDQGRAAEAGALEPTDRAATRPRTLTPTRSARRASASSNGAMSVRAGIVVTGTEVLSGSDHRPQRSLDLRAAGRARGRGRPHPRRRRPARRPRGGAAVPAPTRGCDLIVTTRRPRADRRRPHRRGRRPLRRARAGARRGDGGEDRRDPARLRAAAAASTRRRCASANRKQAMVPEGATAIDPVGTAPGLVVPRRRAGGDRPARAAARAAARCGRRRWRPRRSREVLERATPLRELHDADVRDPRVRDRQEPARDRGRGRRPRRRSRSPPACAAARSRSTSATATSAERDRRAGARGPGRAPRQRSLQPRRRDDRRAGRRRCCAGRRLGARGVVQRRPAGGADHRPARRLGLHGRRRRRLLERGQDRAARGRRRR